MVVEPLEFLSIRDKIKRLYVRMVLRCRDAILLYVWKFSI